MAEKTRIVPWWQCLTCSVCERSKTSLKSFFKQVRLFLNSFFCVEKKITETLSCFHAFSLEKSKSVHNSLLFNSLSLKTTKCINQFSFFPVKELFFHLFDLLFIFEPNGTENKCPSFLFRSFWKKKKLFFFSFRTEIHKIVFCQFCSMIKKLGTFFVLARLNTQKQTSFSFRKSATLFCWQEVKKQFSKSQIQTFLAKNN